MSWINETLKEEYERSQRFLATYEANLADLPKGYLSIKTINGHKQYYLQWRDGTKIRSKYIAKNDIENVKRLIDKRKYTEGLIKKTKRDIKQLQRIMNIE